MLEGEHAQATILKIWDSGTTGRDHVSIGLLLEVRPANRSAYQAQITLVDRRSRLLAFRVGQIIRVQIDPADPRRITIHNERGIR
jgi:hypothetical protein